MHPAFAIARNVSTQPQGGVTAIASMSITTTGTGTTSHQVRTGVSS
jgi:hypothetical protein